MSNENRRRAAQSGWTRRRAAGGSGSVEAGASAASPDPELVRRQAEAAVEEIEALAAVRALVKPDGG